MTLCHQLGATTINSFSYTYDKVGNRKSKADNSGTANYTYDVLNRLTQAVNPLPTNPLETFNYDPVGNRTNSNQNGSSIFNAANQLNEDANFTYQYDNNGNMTQKTAKVGGAITQYEYDAENKLVHVVSPTNTVNYKYDGLGRRVEKEVIAGTTTTTKYVYDNEDILLELNGANSIVARYTHGPGIDEPLIIEKNSQSFYYHTDGLGSITELTNQSGAVAQRYTYSSFGKIESQLDPNFVQPYTFTAREIDPETGLYYYRARYYDSSVGRFISEDPIRFRGGVHFYRYAGNNPIIYGDPSGLRSEKCCYGETVAQSRAAGAAAPWAAVLSVVARYVAAETGLPDPHNGPQDAFRHCYWSCLMAKQIGQERAKAVGDTHEECDDEQPSGQRMMDEHNNAVGRGCGSPGSDCRNCCLSSVAGGITQNSTPAEKNRPAGRYF